MKNFDTEIIYGVGRKIQKFLPYIFLFIIIVSFGFLTFLTLYFQEDKQLKAEGDKRVQAIENIRYDKNTLNQLLLTPEPEKVNGQGGKNPFQTF